MPANQKKKRIFSVALWLVRLYTQTTVILILSNFFLCAVPDDHASTLCGRPLQPVELHEFPAVAVHRCSGAGFNLPPIYET